MVWEESDWEESDDPQKRKAKARLAVLGYMDPRLHEVERDAPTLTTEDRTAILQHVASKQWDLCSFNITASFLRGTADASNPLAMDPPEVLRGKMQLKPNEVCQLVGNAYGRVDAPLLFYRELTMRLRELNFQTHPLEPRVRYLSTGKGKGVVLRSVLGTHVGDGWGATDTSENRSKNSSVDSLSVHLRNEDSNLQGRSRSRHRKKLVYTASWPLTLAKLVGDNLNQP